MSSLNEILMDIAGERARQHHLHGDQTHLPNGTGGPEWQQALQDAREAKETAYHAGELTFGLILLEEVMEVMAEPDPAKLRVELVQVAAVCAQFVQAIDAREARDD